MPYIFSKFNITLTFIVLALNFGSPFKTSAQDIVTFSNSEKEISPKVKGYTIFDLEYGLGNKTAELGSFQVISEHKYNENASVGLTAGYLAFYSDSSNAKFQATTLGLVHTIDFMSVKNITLMAYFGVKVQIPIAAEEEGNNLRGNQLFTTSQIDYGIGIQFNDNIRLRVGGAILRMGASFSNPTLLEPFHFAKISLGIRIG